jgi:hypothetical protein
MTTFTNNSISYAKQNPILIGGLSILAVIMLGVVLAFAAGFITPHAVKADDFGDDSSFGLDDGSGDSGDTGFSLTDSSDYTDTSVNTGVDTTVDTPADTSTGDTQCCDVPLPVETTPVVDTAPPAETEPPVDIPVDISTGDTPCCDTTPVDTVTPEDTSADISTGDTPCCDVTPPATTDTPADISTGDTPCCETTPVDTPADISSGDTPCCTDVTPPEETTPPVVETPPVETPPVIIPPPVVTPECPENDTGIYPDCVPPIIITSCPAGDTGTYPDCIPPTHPVCPAGDTGVYPNCVPPTPPVCPTGDTGTYPNCVPPTHPVCPAGDTGVYPNCVTPCTINCGGGGGGGGGGVSGQTTYGGGGGGGVSGQLVAAAPASYVYLSQIPYTGLDLGPIGTVVYWTLLVLWCLAAAYLIIFTLIPFIYHRIYGFGMNVGALLNQPAGAAVAVAGAHGAAAPAHAAPATHVVHATTTTTTKTNNPSAYSAAQGFRSFAQGQELTIDDIVNGLSRLPENAPAPAAHFEEAHTAPTYQSVEEIIASHAPVTQQQPAHYSAPARQEAPAVAISTDVRDFCAALLNGDRDAVFGTMRQIVREGGDAETFLTQVVVVLDDAYRARVDGTKVNPEIARLTQNCATPFLERLTSALTNAVDSSYTPGISGSKLALTRALAVVEG